MQLALPDRPGAEQERGNRRMLQQLIEGLEVHWSPEQGERWRACDGAAPAARPARRAWPPRSPPGSSTARACSRRLRAPPRTAPSRFRSPSSTTCRPRPAPTSCAPDWDTELDFHQALSSLNAYPGCPACARHRLRPRAAASDFVPLLPGGQSATCPSAALTPAGNGRSARSPALETACVHLELEDGRRVFLTAPRAARRPLRDGASDHRPARPRSALASASRRSTSTARCTRRSCSPRPGTTPTRPEPRARAPSPSRPASGGLRPRGHAAGAPVGRLLAVRRRSAASSC